MRRRWPEGNEAQRFITSVAGSAIKFDYNGRHQELLTMIGPSDVQWAARQMAGSATRRGATPSTPPTTLDPYAERYIRRIKEKIRRRPCAAH